MGEKRELREKPVSVELLVETDLLELLVHQESKVLLDYKDCQDLLASPVFQEALVYLTGLIGLDVRQHHTLAPRLPVDGGGNLLGCGELKRVDDPEDLVEVASGRGRIEDGQLQFLVGTDDEDGSGRQRNARRIFLIGV